MASGTFVAHRIVRFPEAGRTFTTEEKRPRGSVDEEADPVFTRMNLRRAPLVEGFSQARLTHRKGVRIEGYWHGNPVTEVVQEKRFPAYYDVGRAIFVSRVQKQIAMSAIAVLNDELADFDLRQVELDFTNIIPVASNVIGSWFKGMRYTNIRSEAAFGDHIDRDAEFLRMSGLGRHSNLVVVIPFEDAEVKVNISRDGSVYFLEDYDLETCLRFVVYLLQFQVAPARQ